MASCACPPEQTAKRSGFEISSGLILFGVAVLGVLLILMTKKTALAMPAGSYTNAETWNISYNSEGLPTTIEVHRDAKRA